MLDKLISEVSGVFGLNPPTRRRKRVTSTVRRKRPTRSYSAPARRTKKRPAKRTTRRRR